MHFISVNITLSQILIRKFSPFAASFGVVSLVVFVVSCRHWSLVLYLMEQVQCCDLSPPRCCQIRTFSVCLFLFRPPSNVPWNGFEQRSVTGCMAVPGKLPWRYLRKELFPSASVFVVFLLDTAVRLVLPAWDREECFWAPFLGCLGVFALSHLLRFLLEISKIIFTIEIVSNQKLWDATIDYQIDFNVTTQF